MDTNVISLTHPKVPNSSLEPLKSDDAKYAHEGVDVARWFLDNVYVPNHQASTNNSITKKQINKAIAAAKAKHKIP